MALASAQTAKSVAAADVASWSATLAAPPTAGNLLYVVFGCRGVINMTVTATALTAMGYALATPIQDGGDTGAVAAVWWKVSNGTETGAHTVTTSVNTRGNLFIQEVVDDVPGGAWTLDKATGANGGAVAAVSASSGTTAAIVQAAEWVAAGFSLRGLFGATDTYTNGFAERDNAASSGTSTTAAHLRVADRVTSAIAAQETTHAWTNSRTWAAVIAAFRSVRTGTTTRFIPQIVGL